MVETVLWNPRPSGSLHTGFQGWWTLELTHWHWPSGSPVSTTICACWCMKTKDGVKPEK